MADIGFFTLPNLSASQVTERAPWDFTPAVPASVQADKTAYREWLAEISTAHCLYTLSEGELAGMRVSKENTCRYIHGFVADYDVKVSDTQMQEAIKAQSGEFPPTFAHKTFSGGCRLIWKFSSPALVSSNRFAQSFLSVVRRKLRVKDFLPGLDDVCINPLQYYDVGSAWVKVSDKLITEPAIYAWLFDASKVLTVSDMAGPVIPLSVIKQEIDERFPGRWEGEFAHGSVGVRFWDAAADNPRACLVNKYGTGMVCFSGGVAFMPWSAIFGHAFVEKYRENTLGAALANVWCTGRGTYWRKMEDGQWFAWQREDFKMYLQVHHKLDTTKRKGMAVSELAEVMQAVHDTKRVDAVRPYVYFPDGPLTIDGERVLNPCTVRVVPPAPLDPDMTEVPWGVGFPWISKFLEVFFPNTIVRERFLAWLQRAYVYAYRLEPVPGQVLLIAGDVTRGKSLLSTVIVSQLLGGSVDASSFFLGEERFTGHIWTKPLLTIDDTVPNTSSMRNIRYTAMLKKVVATGNHNYEQKFKDAGPIVWFGRVIVTLNTDPDSLRLLPSLDMSNADKIMMLVCNMDKVFPLEFPERSVLAKMIAKEIPYLGRWLMNWTMPEHCRGTSRMGVAPYHDKTLVATSIHEGEAFNFMEVLQLFLIRYRKVFPERDKWKGSVSKLVLEMGEDEGLRPLLSRYTPNGIARFLGQLRGRGFDIQAYHTRTSRIWTIPMSLADTEVRCENE
jgi:hypothetical protein